MVPKTTFRHDKENQEKRKLEHQHSRAQKDKKERGDIFRRKKECELEKQLKREKFAAMSS